MTRSARALIDLEALRHNFNRAKQAAPGCRVMAVVKANAYGHGMLRVAGALPAADAFAVARINEGVELRQAGIAKPVVLLSGVESTRDLQRARELNLDLVVHSAHQIEMLESARQGARLRVWLKLDSGMHRLGFPLERALELHTRLKKASRVVAGEPVLMTHLADADGPERASVSRQIESFVRATEGIDAPRSIANSGGLLGYAASRAEWVRPGLMLYGVSPFEGGGDQDLAPVMTMRTRLIAVNQIPKGGRIGYGGTYTCAESMPVGVAAIGYGDGYPRHASSGTPVLVNGVRCPLAGRVSMDMITIDLRPLPAAQPGDPVVLWGRDLPVEEISRHAGTIAYELLCRLPPRVDYEAI